MTARKDGTSWPSWVNVLILSDSPAESPVVLRIELEHDEPVLTAITVLRRPGKSLRSSAVRDAAVRRLTDQAVSALVEAGLVTDLLTRGEAGIEAVASIIYARMGQGGDPEMAATFDAELARRQSEATGNRRRTITAQLLEDVRSIYLKAEHAPTRAVAEQLHTSHRNATRWIAEARQRGLLTENKEDSE